MPEKETLERARRDKREGKSPSTQAGEFIREEIHHIREGKHGAASTKQAIAIGLSKARRAGVKLPPPRRGTASKRTIKEARNASKAGAKRTKKPQSRARSRAATRRLRRQPRSAGSPQALARHARTVARSRTAAQRRASARKAVRTKGPQARSAAARKAARTRARHA